jgi:hypothetical protein
MMITTMPRPTAIPLPTDDFKDLGLTYWHQLVKAGTPKNEAQIIAATMAKFELFHKLPTPEQKQLLLKCSRYICRAHLWRSDLLL